VEKIMTRFTLKLVESDAEITKKILSILENQVSIVFKKAEALISKKARLIMFNSIKNQPEYFSLIESSGTLRLEFGLEDVSIVDKIIEALLDSTIVLSSPVRKRGNSLKGNIEIKMISNDKIKELTSSVFIVTEKSQKLPWLSWLLESGLEPIVKGFEVSYVPSQFSRTGGAIMIDSKKNWRVPAEFAGTISNNWFVRSVDTIDDQIIEVIRQSILESL
jgi:hypothetical protein